MAKRRRPQNETPIKMIHRDDFDMEVVEACLDEISTAHPHLKIGFIGDCYAEDTLPKAIARQLRELQEAFDGSLCTGTCLDCGASMEGFSVEALQDESWESPEGWLLWRDASDNTPSFWQCPNCSEENGD